MLAAFFATCGQHPVYAHEPTAEWPEGDARVWVWKGWCPDGQAVVRDQADRWWPVKPGCTQIPAALYTAPLAMECVDNGVRVKFGQIRKWDPACHGIAPVDPPCTPVPEPSALLVLGGPGWRGWRTHGAGRRPKP